MPPEQRRRLPARPPRAAREVRLQLRRSTATSARAASTRRIDFDLRHRGRASQTYRAFLDEAADLVVSLRRLDLRRARRRPVARPSCCPRCSAPSWSRAFGEFKAIWDPDSKMNPGKVVDPYPPGENLRLGPAYNPPQVETHFKFPDDKGSFACATLRCVGVGKCRKDEGGDMCPSYMVTSEEMHSTRGRARLLFEMLQGDPIDGGLAERGGRRRRSTSAWRARGARRECPMNVDMATYKAEFLSHYYEGRLRPRHAYAMGLIYWWARLAVAARRAWSTSSRQTPVLGDVCQGRSAGSRRSGGCRRSPPRRFKALVPRRGPAQRRRAAGDPLARHVQQPLPPADGAGRRRGAGGRRLPGRRSRRGRSAAAGRSTTSACSTRAKRLLPRDPRHAAAARSTPGDAGRRPGAELRGGLPRRAGEPFPDDEDAKRLRPADLHAQRVPRARRRRTSSRRGSSGKALVQRPLPPRARS